jgi:hypothetical protein
MLRPNLTVHILQKRKVFLKRFVKSEPNGYNLQLRNSTHDLQSLIHFHHSFSHRKINVLDARILKNKGLM